MMFPEASWHWLSQSNNQKFLALVGAVAAAVLWLVHQRIPKNVHGPEHPDPAAGFNNLAKLFREKATGIERPNVTLVVNTNWIDGVPIPDDVKVSPAPQSASETQKRLLGAWAGTSDDSWRHILIVEDIRADGEARVVFASSKSSEWSREEGRVAGDTLSLDEGLVTYKLTATDRLLAEFECFTHVAQARMSRIELAALTRLGATIDWSDGVEFLDTDLTEDGKPVHLEAVLFKPKGSGPFPLLVFNHGRLCWGASRWLTWTETHLELAEFFLEKGWMVAFPQRRGRGKSDGLHGEGLDERGEALFVYDPGRSLSGAERALRDIEAAIAALQRRPDVAGKRLLIGGGRREEESCRSRMRDYIPNRSPASSTLSGAGPTSVIGGQASSTEGYLRAARDMIERHYGSTAIEILYFRLSTADRISRPSRGRAARESLSNFGFPARMATI